MACPHISIIATRIQITGTRMLMLMTVIISSIPNIMYMATIAIIITAVAIINMHISMIMITRTDGGASATRQQRGGL